MLPKFVRIISGQNAKGFRDRIPNTEVKKCNCPNTKPCPLDGQCLEENIVYQASVSSSDGGSQKYIGITAPQFKKCFKNLKYCHETTLSSFIWKLKEQNLDFEVKWKLICRAKPYSPITDICNLCTKEKFYILFCPEEATLNSRNEIYSHCRHKQAMLLDKTWLWPRLLGIRIYASDLTFVVCFVIQLLIISDEWRTK